jgi:4-amino-4-deoxy-L-arabinose transferase-like glycosyltransferase
MSSKKEPAQSPVVVVLSLILLLAFALRLWIAFSPLDTQLAACLADDALYYLVIAENILAGQGVVFDGVTATNGFHPLFMGICLALKLLFPGELTVLPMMLFFAMLSALNAFLLYLLARRLGGSVAGIAAAAFWAFHPYTRFADMMGVEVPLALAFVLAASLWWIGVIDERLNTKGAWVILGALVGFAFLARTDTGIFAIAIAIHVLVAFRRTLREKAGDILLAGGTATAVIMPWLLWCLVKFGRITQDSGRALIYYATDGIDSTGSLLANAVAQWPTVRDRYLLDFIGVSDRRLGLYLALGFALFALIALVLKKEKRPGLLRLAPALIAFALGTWGFYNFFLATRKMYYFVPFLALSALAFAIAIGLIAERAGRWRWFVVAAAFVFLAPPWYATARKLNATGLQPWQGVYLQVARDLDEGLVEAVGPDDKIASWNAGIYGAYSGHRVVNLDGVVNPEVLDAIKQRRFFEYVQQSGAKHIVDHGAMVGIYQRYSTREMMPGLKVVKVYKVPGMPGADVAVMTLKSGMPDSVTKKPDSEPSGSVQ